MNESFKNKLREAINSCSLENASDTPDFVLTEFLVKCLDAFDSAVRERDTFHKNHPVIFTEKKPLEDGYLCPQHKANIECFINGQRRRCGSTPCRLM